MQIFLQPYLNLATILFFCISYILCDYEGNFSKRLMGYIIIHLVTRVSSDHFSSGIAFAIVITILSGCVKLVSLSSSCRRHLLSN